MSHQVLARKWRPRTFDALVGQDHVVRALDHALKSGRLHHAYLFTGTRGVGKTTIARILAKAVNCETGMTPSPCGACPACTEIDQGRFVDYLELDAASNRGVDEMAQLLDNAVYAPSAGRFKVYVIDEVHMLTAHAFNAMLKTLEEPPPHVLFILATTDPQKVPVTVLSRCMQFNLRNMRAEAIAEYLEKVLQAEAIAFEPPALPALGKAAAGSMRDALSLLDQAIAFGAGQVQQAQVAEMLGTIDADHVHRVFGALADGDQAALVAIADEVADQNIGADSLLAELSQAVADLAVAQDLSAATDPGRLESFASRWAGVFSAHDLQVFYQILIYARRDLPLAPDVRCGLTMALLRLAAFQFDDAPAASQEPAGGAGARSASPVAGRPAMTERPASSHSAAPAQVKTSPPAGGADARPLSGAAAARAALAGKTAGTPRAAAEAGTVPAAAPSRSGSDPRRSSALRAALSISAATPPEQPARPAPAAAQTPGLAAQAAADSGADERWEDEANSLAGSDSVPGGPATIASPARASFADFDGNWPGLAQEMGLPGRLGQFMQQSELTGRERQAITLLVPIQPLAEPSVIKRAEQALSEWFGQAITLTVNVGTVAGDTAARRDGQMRAEQLEQARETIESDPFIKTLLADFDGQIVPDSIRVIDNSSQKGEKHA
ncbi:MAG: DNA polymerase III subunit gamma/tau [Burkholderiaceae bacterium]